MEEKTERDKTNERCLEERGHGNLNSITVLKMKIPALLTVRLPHWWPVFIMI